LSQEEKKGEIARLSRELSELREQKDKADSEANEWANKRNDLNEQFRLLRIEIADLRSERDRLNEDVKDLKLQRSALKERVREKIPEIKKLKQDIRELADERPPKRYHDLQKEVESIDWKIQTTSLTPQREKELVNQVKQLETELNVYRKLERLRNRAHELQTEVESIDAKIKLSHDKLTGLAQKSQEIHQKMLEKIDDSKRLKLEAENLHKSFLQSIEKTKPIEEKMVEVSSHIRRLRDEIQSENGKERQERERDLRKELEEKAREKLRRREKLSWEEFQLLAEKGMATQD
jgi:uncharacterized coiled-coil DUF342 family protein